MELRQLKKLYDLLGSDALRATALTFAESMGIGKELVRMDTNNVCNIECIMCANKPEKCTADRMMSLDDFRRLMGNIRKGLRFLYLSCSYEPLMTPHFEDCLSIAKSSGAPFISFATNGLLLSDSLIRFLVDERISEIILSMNGFTKEDYDRIMYRSRYDTVIEKLAALRDYKRSKGSALPRIRVNTILMKTNVLSFGRIVDFINAYDVDTVQFRSFKVDERHNNNPSEIEKERLSGIAPDEMGRIAAEINRQVLELTEAGKRIIMPKELFAAGRIGEARDASMQGSCSIPFFSSWIDFRGDVRVCCGEHEDARIGNILRDTPETLKKNRAAFRKMALLGKCRKNCLMYINSSTMM
jgi:MoaA/NifB/PqqE/SkfB family radical SAM enzyme